MILLKSTPLLIISIWELRVDTAKSNLSISSLTDLKLFATVCLNDLNAVLSTLPEPRVANSFSIVDLKLRTSAITLSNCCFIPFDSWLFLDIVSNPPSRSAIILLSSDLYSIPILNTPSLFATIYHLTYIFTLHLSCNSLYNSSLYLCISLYMLKLAEIP